MTDAHAAAVLAIYQAGIEEGNATFESRSPVVLPRPGQETAARRGARRATRSASCPSAASKLPGSPTGTGSGMDQCTARGSPSSSWARSHTVTTRSPSCRTSLMWRGRSRGSARRWRCGGGDGAGIDRLGRVRAGRYRRDGAGPAPQRGGQVGAGRVGGAHEQHPQRRAGCRGSQPVQGAGDQLQVGAAAVALGPTAGDEPGLLQRVQVVRQQVGRHGQHYSQLGRGRVARKQRVGDLQPRRIGQRSVNDRASLQLRGSISNH